MLYFHRLLAQVEKPPWGAVRIFELGPALLQADAQPVSYVAPWDFTRYVV